MPLPQPSPLYTDLVADSDPLPGRWATLHGVIGEPYVCPPLSAAPWPVQTSERLVRPKTFAQRRTASSFPYQLASQGQANLNVATANAANISVGFGHGSMPSNAAVTGTTTSPWQQQTGAATLPTAAGGSATSTSPATSSGNQSTPMTSANPSLDDIRQRYHWMTCSVQHLKEEITRLNVNGEREKATGAQQVLEERMFRAQGR